MVGDIKECSAGGSPPPTNILINTNNKSITSSDMKNSHINNVAAGLTTTINKYRNDNKRYYNEGDNDDDGGELEGEVDNNYYHVKDRRTSQEVIDGSPVAHTTSITTNIHFPTTSQLKDYLSQ
jgi:hypothetical protein